MSQNNDQEEKDQEKQEGPKQDKQNQPKKNIMIDYSLKVDDDAVTFSLHSQSPEVTDFLNRVGTYMAANGIRIQLGYTVQWKDSTNTIYLNSGLNSINQLNKPDITYFGKQLHFVINPGSAKQTIRNKVAMFEAALAELTETVKATYAVPSKPERSGVVRRVLN